MAKKAHGRAPRARAQPHRHAGPRDEGARHGPGVRRDRRHAGEGHARPGALGGGIAAAGQNAAAAKEKAEEDAAYAEHDAEEAQLRRSAEDRGRREAAEAARAANNYWGGSRNPRRSLRMTWRGRVRHLEGEVRQDGPRALPSTRDSARQASIRRGSHGCMTPHETCSAHTTPTGRQGPTLRPPEARPTSTIRDGPCREHAREET